MQEDRQPEMETTSQRYQADIRKVVALTVQQIMEYFR